MTTSTHTPPAIITEAEARQWAVGERDASVRSVTRLRGALVQGLGFGEDAEALAATLHELAAAEGYRNLFAQVVAILDRGHTTDDVVEQVQRSVTLGADDQWSGRTNNVRRARFDGTLRAAAAVFGAL